MGCGVVGFWCMMEIVKIEVRICNFIKNEEGSENLCEVEGD